MTQSRRILFAMLAAMLVTGWFSVLPAQTDKKEPPETIVFESKFGAVTFQHSEHIKREESKCETCHPAIFPQAREPLNFAKGMHKPAEAAKSSCATCHHAEGRSFETKGNCVKCHKK